VEIYLNYLILFAIKGEDRRTYIILIDVGTNHKHYRRYNKQRKTNFNTTINMTLSLKENVLVVELEIFQKEIK
jgi:hypothetical protein